MAATSIGKSNSTMKKSIIIFSLLSLVIAMTACSIVVETELEQDQAGEVTPPAQDVKLVPMTFTATCSPDDEDDEDTKTILSGLNIEWKAGDKVAVFDNENPSIIHEFEATADGPVTTLTGTVTDGSSKFLAVYPYSAALSAEFPTEGDRVGNAMVSIPTVQRPVVGSFDPAAAVVVAYAEGSTNELSFRIPFTVVKFSVDYDDVYSVSLSSDIDMSGGFRASFKSKSEMLVGSTGTRYQSVTVKNADNTPFTKGAVYYAILRYGTHTTFRATLGNTSLAYAYKEKSSVSFDRKKVYNLGEFSGMTFTTNRYKGYMDGLNVTIAGETYNVSDDGDATLFSDGGIFTSSTTGVVFVESGASITNTSETTITGNVVIASNNPSSPATYTGTLNKSILLKSGSLVMDNMVVNLDALSSGQFMTKKDNDGNFTALTLYQCDFKHVKRYVFAPNSSYLNKGIETVTINGCRFATDAAVQLFAINSSATTLAGYGLFTFTNNVVYSTTGEPLQTYVFSTSAAGVAENTAKQDLVMDNNLFYNVAASSGIFRTYYVNSAYIRNNVLWAKDGSYSSNIKMFGLNLETANASSVFTGASSDNYCYGDLGEKEWSIADTKYRGPLTNVTTLATNPISSFNLSTGEFVLEGAYSTYGPQLQPF